MKFLALPLIILLAIWASYLALQTAPPQYQWPIVASDNEIGLRPVDCWFGTDVELPPIECYDMQVPERHGKPDSRFITFPVMVMRTTTPIAKRSPLLHLGAGGPGAPMNLDDPYVARELLQTLTYASLKQGRDLIVIDPRGTGLARPALVCAEFIEGERLRLRQNLTLEETRDSVVADYRKCIDRFLDEGVDPSGYNSFAIAQDIEALRRVTGVERWVLLGISYGANYALTIADEFPDRVESMVLDSAFVSRVAYHERYIEWMTRPYRLLFNYCKHDPDCQQPIPRVKERFWALYEKLNKTPISMEFEYAVDQDKIALVLDGERFLDAIMQGIYGVEIFRDLPRIITDLENGDHRSLHPYLWLHVDYMLHPTWGDVSEMAHYCYETRPFTDFDLIRSQFAELPAGYLRDNAEFFLDWPDHCEQMNIREAAPRLIPSQKLVIPTLFLHGKLDSITPLSSVRSIQRYFKNAHVLTFDLGHSILTSSDCALDMIAIFIADPFVSRKLLACQ